MKMISPKQQKILDFIEEFTVEHGYAPSVREIATRVGLRSTSTVHTHLLRLQEAGYLEPADHKSRTLSAKGGPILVPRVPLFDPDKPIEYIFLATDFVPYSSATCNGKYFALRVHDNAMSGVGILDGDLVIARRDAQAQDGNIVVVQQGKKAFCRMLHRTPTEMWLMSANSDIPPVRGEMYRVIGVVEAMRREYNIAKVEED